MLISHVEKEILNIASNDLKGNLSIQLAYSGGMDSSCLLDVLCKLKQKIGFNLFVTYVNYNTSPYSLDVSRYVKSLPLDIVKTIKDVRIESQYNFESKARNLRYSIFRDLVKKNKIDYTFTAHHMADQIETLIMKFVDGSDLISMSGIRSEIKGVYRPFLKIDKKTIIKYIKKHNILYFKDPSNEDISFRRNKIRKMIVPIIANDIFFLNKIKSINRQSIDMMKKSGKIIKRDLRCSILECSSELGFVSVCLDKLKSYDIILLKLFLKSVVKKYFDIDSLQKSNSFWLECFTFLNSSKVGARFNFSNRIIFLKDRDSIFIVDNDKASNKSKVKIHFSRENKLDLGTVSVVEGELTRVSSKYSCIVSEQDFKNGIFARKWKYGDKVKLSSGSKKVSDLFIDSKLPLFKKNIYPVFENSKSEIIWIPGIYIKKKYNNLRQVVMEWEE